MARGGVMYDETWLAQQLQKPGYRLVDVCVPAATTTVWHPLTAASQTERRTSPTPYRSHTEGRYAALLEARLLRGEIFSWRYEALKLRLADKTFYTPDFLVQVTRQSLLELHEVKGGWWRDDAKVKWKVAIAQYPYFAFVLCQY